MNILKNMLVLAIFASVISLAMLGGTWATSLAAGTVPNIPLFGPGGAGGGGGAVIPVTGAGALIPVTGAGCTLTECVLNKINPKTLPQGIEVRDTDAYKCEASNCVIKLNDPVLVDAFKKDPNLSILWYDLAKKEWVKLITTLEKNSQLENGALVADVPDSGYVVFGLCKDCSSVAIPVTGKCELEDCTLTEVELNVLPSGVDIRDTTAYECLGSNCKIKLSDAALVDAFKKNPNLSILWYNGKNWVPLITTIENGLLVAGIPEPGYIVFGSIK